MKNLGWSKENKLLLIFGSVLVLVLLIAGVLTAVFLEDSDDKSGDIGTEIPENFSTYQGTDFSFGYPEDQVKVEDLGGIYIAYDSTNASVFEVQTGTVFSVVPLTNAPDSETIISSTEDSDCDTVKVELEASYASAQADISVTSNKAVILNGAPGCEIEISGGGADSLMYLVVKNGVGYQLVVSNVASEASENYDVFLEILKTFRIDAEPQIDAPAGDLQLDEILNNLDELDLDL